MARHGRSVFCVTVPWLIAVFASVVSANWGDWTDWSECSMSCGFGVQIRRRVSEPKEGGSARRVEITDHSYCNLGRCPVDGSWSHWTGWGQCDAMCDGGTRIRKRGCTKPPPENEGKECAGKSYQKGECNRIPCPPLPDNFHISQCTKDDFLCRNNLQCVSINSTCDRIIHCHDGSDEMNCSKDGPRLAESKSSGTATTWSGARICLSVLTFLWIVAVRALS